MSPEDTRLAVDDLCFRVMPRSLERGLLTARTIKVCISTARVDEADPKLCRHVGYPAPFLPNPYLLANRCHALAAVAENSVSEAMKS
eukprot:766145-Hanusia_phi.AAC.7